MKENKGYGYGILKGLEHAKGEYLGWTHADSQTDPNDVLIGHKLLENETASDIFLKGKRYGRPKSDLFFTHAMSLIELILLKQLLIDINAQPTLFSRDFYEKWTNPPFDFSLDLYSYFLAKKNKLKIIRFPVAFGKRIYGTSSWNTGLKGRLKFIMRTLNFSSKLSREKATF